MNFEPLSKKEKTLAQRIVDSAFTVHKKLDPGLLEEVYEVCFCHELFKRGFKFRRQIPIIKKGIKRYVI